MACGQSVHILLMEDDAGQAELAQRTLERAGYTMEVVDNGATGLVLVATGAYDVLLVDYSMPGTRATGINAFVTKPGQGRELAPTIRRVLDQQVSMPRFPSEPSLMEE